MGNIRKVLALTELDPRAITATGIWGDLCEDIHLHYRNVRFDFSEKEWAQMRAAVHAIGAGIEHSSIDQDYSEGDPNFLIQICWNEAIRHDAKYYPNRFVIELERDDTVHVHYRDLRLHLSLPEFTSIADAFIQARKTIDEIKPFPFADLTARKIVIVPIETIQPYDAGHRPGAIDAEHRAGIEHAKNLLLQGKNLRPILVDTNGQRLDGFKRYMAQLEMGQTHIECIVDPYPVELGGQSNQSMLVDNDK